MTITQATDYSARIVRGSRSATVGTSLFVVTTVVLALLPWWGSKATQFTLVEILYYLSLAQLWNLLAGYAGLVSVGQQGFRRRLGTVFLGEGNTQVSLLLNATLSGHFPSAIQGRARRGSG